MKTDPPETFDQFFSRVISPTMHPKATIEGSRDYINSFRDEWKAQEKEKEEYQKQLEREKTEYEKTVNRLQVEIEREKNRIAREESRKRERDAREEQRDPTPNILPASSIPPIPFSIRDQHVFIPGMTRHGKSTQLFHLILDDINNDRGVAVLDPIKADLITELLPYIPERRLKDCIYLDLKNPIPLDVMRPTPNPEQLVGDIKALVLRGQTNLDRAEPILTKLLHALLSIPGSKFTDIEDVFTLPSRKQWFLDNLKQCDVRRFEYWSTAWPPRDHTSPLINRMTNFTENPSLRTILGHTHPILNLRKAMDERKIILVSLPGKSEITRIYGSLLVSRFQQAALSRAEDNVPKNERVPFCLFVDEFEEFQTSSFAEILEAAGGLKLFITVGNQHIFQLTDEIRHSILGNVANFIIFKLGEGENEFSRAIHPFKPYRIGLIPKHQAIFKIGDAPPEFHWTKPAPHGAELPNELQNKSNEIRAFLIAQTREQYGLEACDRQAAELMNAQYGMKRTVDGAACNSTTVPHNEGNDDEPQPGAEPTRN